MAIALPDKPPIVMVPASRVLWRVHQTALGALWFGRSRRYRFDDPRRLFGVAYLGESPAVSVLETLVRGWARCAVDQQEWEARSVSRVHLAEKLRMLQFEGDKLPVFGVGVERASAAGYAECQRLSAELQHAHPELDGIQYRSRWDPTKLCWALFDRASHKIARADPSEPLAGSAIGDEVLDSYRILLV
ncbi:MAG TPA: RES family NAD+ phosphorylase [Longimicrobium sp.]|jgi:hypothetical protein